MSVEIAQAIAVTAELCGTNLSDPAKRMMMQDLSGYPDAAVIQALSACRKQLKGRLTLSEIISRIDDGRPGVEEAWAKLPRDEATTAVWTDEMRQAWAVALPLLEVGEDVAARMAFKEAYTRIVTAARDSGAPVVWSVTVGTDAHGRRAVIEEAAAQGLISHERVQFFLPIAAPTPEGLALLEHKDNIVPPEKALEIIAGLREKFGVKTA